MTTFPPRETEPVSTMAALHYAALSRMLERAGRPAASHLFKRAAYAQNEVAAAALVTEAASLPEAERLDLTPELVEAFKTFALYRVVGQVLAVVRHGGELRISAWPPARDADDDSFGTRQDAVIRALRDTGAVLLVMEGLSGNPDDRDVWTGPELPGYPA